MKTMVKMRFTKYKVSIQREEILMSTVYVHFSFRRPKNASYGIFAVAMFADEDGKKFLGSTTRAFNLWRDQQYVSAIQSYEHALYCIWENQQKMSKAGVTDVMLVTDNSTLAKWIENPNCRPDYAKYMKMANKKYVMGGEKTIRLNIGLYKTLKSEKSYKFCREELIQNKKYVGLAGKIDTSSFKNVYEIIDDDKVDVVGIE